MLFQLLVPLIALTQPDVPPKADNAGKDDVILRAMADELERAKSELQLGDLPKPYFIAMSAQDRLLYSMRAAYGGLIGSQDQHNRYISVRTRVGSYELDNSNVPGSRGQVGVLPLDNDYVALRHAIWLVLDDEYKDSVETLTRKLAYLKQKAEETRHDDFSPASPVVELQPVKELDFDAGAAEDLIKKLSARFTQHTKIQDSDVELIAGDSTHWVVNSEGTRVRTSDTGIMLQIDARLQAADGMPIGDSLTYLGLTTSDLPPEDVILADIDKMANQLVAIAEGPRLDQYTGPVLFEPKAAGTVFDTLLSDKLCARPLPIGARYADSSLEKKIGLRILPRSFEVHDDPGPQWFEKTLLAGAYEFDDDGVPAENVDLVEKGILQTMLASRAPTDKIKKSNGHGRGGGMVDTTAMIGCLYIEDTNGLSREDLRKELILAAKDEGLPYGLRVESLHPGRGDNLGDPVRVYKVFVEDSREEPVRGMKFMPVQTRALKRLLAAGKDREVYNALNPVGKSIITPAILFEELELAKTEQEFDKLPILPSPLYRDGTAPMAGN